MEKLTALVLRKPVTTLLCVIGLLFFGTLTLLFAKLELTPNLSAPSHVVTTVYAGASPEDIDRLITKPMEAQFAELSDVKSMTSVSSENSSTITLEYNFGKDVDKAYIDLKKKIDTVKPDLPEKAEDPVVTEVSDSGWDNMTIAIDNPTQESMYTYVDTVIKPQLERLGTVGAVSISGGRKGYVKVELQPEKLLQYHVDRETLSQALERADFSLPLGSALLGDQKLSVGAEIRYATVESMKQIPISLGDGHTIYLKDIAEVSYDLEEQTEIGRFNGVDSVDIGVKKRPQYSAVTLSNQVKAQLEKLSAEDENLEFTVINDDADMILSSLRSVFETMVMAVVISMLVLYFFFGDWKASCIVGTSIPLSILASLIFMWVCNFSTNVITISALVLGVGMMVDNSIVVLEACFRSAEKYAEDDPDRGRKAAVDAVRQVGMSVFGSTLTTCVVFVPLTFLTGVSGQLFGAMGATIVFCMVASFFSAITIVPVCYNLYKPRENERALAYRWIRVMQGGYRGFMPSLLRHKGKVLLATILLFAISVGLVAQLDLELMPSTDQGQIEILIDVKPGLNIHDLDQRLRSIEERIAADEDTLKYSVTVSEVETAVYDAGSTIMVWLKKDRSMPTKEKALLWRRTLADIPDVSLSIDSISQIDYVMGKLEDNFEQVLQGSDYGKLKQASDRIVSRMQRIEDLTEVHSDAENGAPRVVISIDPIQASAEGMLPYEMGEQLYVLLSGSQVRKMDVNGQSIDVKLKYPAADYDTVREVKNAFVTREDGRRIKLDSIAEVLLQDSPASIHRKNRQYQATITAQYTPASTDDTDNRVLAAAFEEEFDADIQLADTDTIEDMKEEFTALGIAILIAFFLVFAVMASQFESMRYSVMVMTCIPVAVIGSFFFLWFADAKISLVTLLGFLMLLGTVVNDGILYVDTVNQYLGEGVAADQALVDAGSLRMRPILMTSFTTVLSMVPMVVGYGQDGALMQGLAIVNAGGLVASTLMALLLLPAYYDLIRKKSIV